MTMQEIEAQVVQVHRGKRYLLLTLEHPAVGSLFLPGQFAQIETRAVGMWDPFLLRPFSVMDEEEGRVHFLILLRGKGSRWLFERRVGDKVRMVGPLGKPFPHRTAVELIGGGSGIAPLYFYARRYPDHVLRLRVGFRTRPPEFLISALQRLSVPVEITTEDGSLGTPGTVLKRWVPRGSSIVTCGPLPMMHAVLQTCPDQDVWVSIEEPMGCGTGLCMGCAAPRKGGGYWRTCLEGPVFPANQLRWEELYHA